MIRKEVSEHGGRRVDQIFTLKEIGKKAQEKKCSVHIGFMDLENA